MTHFDHLLRAVPDLAERHILDIGSGRGSFLIDATTRGVSIVGLEMNNAYRTLAAERAAAQGVLIEQCAGVAETLPFPDESFDFFNMGEVIEHVEDPSAALTEAYRVLRAGGMGYISAPNRFGLIDQHYHLFGINWLPRSFADLIIRLIGKGKSDTGAGRQTLSQMHYYRWGTIARLATKHGFDVEDLRLRTLHTRFGAQAFVLLPLYYLARAIYFDSFHVLVYKR